MNAPGKGILKVASILYIVFGGLWAVVAIIGFFAAGFIADIFGPLAVFGTIGSIFVGIVFLIAAAVNLVVGIIGVKNPTKSVFFIVFGFILGALAVISIVFAFNIWLLLGLVLPVLFVVGGFMNKGATAPVAAAAAE